ncbi:MAG: Sec-independent protein translocase protein TatB [Hyphomicrobiaceae bacterium]
MFDLTSSKLLLLAVVALLVIGPKDFPTLLRAIGKYIGIIRGHAKEFRAQFDEAMRESEFGQIKKEMEKLGSETEATLTATKQSVEQTIAEARQGVEASVEVPAEAAPKATADPLSPAATEGAPTSPPGEPQPGATAEPASVTPAAGSPQGAAQQTAAAPAVERTGA